MMRFVFIFVKGDQLIHWGEININLFERDKIASININPMIFLLRVKYLKLCDENKI